MQRLARLISESPKLILLIFLFLTALLGYGLRYRTTDVGETTFIVRGDPEKAYYDKVKEIFGFEQTIAIGISGTDVFSQETLAKIDRISRQIEKLDHVEDVQSLTTIEDIVGTEEGFEVRDLIETLPSGPEETERIRERAFANPIVEKNLVTEDGRSTFIIIYSEQLDTQPDAKRALIQTIEETAAREAGPEEIHVFGNPLVWTEIERLQSSDLPPLLTLTFLVMATVLYLVFRSIRGVLLPLGASAIGVVWTLGFCSWVGKPIDPITNTIPSILIAIGAAYLIHLLTQYGEEAARSNESRIVARKTVARIGRPIALSGLTTTIGFSSLGISRIPVISEWGLLTGFGVLGVTLIALVLMPAVLALLPVRAALRRQSGDETRIGRMMRRLSGFVVARVSPILIGGLPLLAISLAGLTLVTEESNPIFYFREEAKLYRAFSFFDARRFGPWSTPISIQGAPDSIKEPEVLRAIEKLQQFVDSRTDVYRVNSIIDFIKLMNRATFSDDPAEYRIPDTREAVAQYLLLYSLSGDESRLERFVNHDYSHAYVVTNTPAFTPVQQMDRRTNAIQEYLEDHPIAGMNQRLTGDGILRRNASSAIVLGMIQSIAVAVIVITAIMALLFRSVVAGLFCMVPNVFPLLLNFAIMGFASIHLDVGTALISSVVIGIAVDDTIHLLERYRRLLAVENDHVRALHGTFTSVGRAVFVTSITLCFGFLVLLFSDFTPISYFGVLVGIMMVTCLIGDLLLLPAMLLRYKPRFIEKA